MERLFIIIPAYNEEENIRQVIKDWYQVVEQFGEDSCLVVIDDGSKDDTFRIINECAKQRPLLKPLTKENGGHGSTVLYGYQYALEQGADYIFQTDSDGQTRAEEFAGFWEQRKEYDMVIGSRLKRGDGFARVIVTKVLKLVVRICFGVSIEDVNTPYRLMNANVLAKYIHLIPEDFFLSNVMVSVIFVKKNRKVKFIPITFLPRQGGVNSIKIANMVKIGVRAWKDFGNMRKDLERREE